MNYKKEISVVVPAFNEEEALPYLEPVIRKVMEDNNFDYEVIIVDDGSSDTTWNVVKQLVANNPNIRGVRFQRNYGKAAALNEGFTAARGRVVITMDADLQDRPEEVPELYRMVAKDGWDLVSGWKQNRKDPLSKTIPTQLYNWATRIMSGINLHDFNCGLKAYRYEVIKNIEVFGEMHRYIPILVKTAGFKKITEKKVRHVARKHGRTKYGLNRFINGPLDLLSIVFVTRFSKKPMHFFGTLGLLSFLFGFGILLCLVISRFIWYGYGMTDRPVFYFALLAVVIGVQLFLTGFLAELVSRNAPDRNTYLISEQIGQKNTNSKN